MFWVILGFGILFISFPFFLANLEFFDKDTMIGFLFSILALLLICFGAGVFSSFDWSAVVDFFKPIEPEEIEHVVCHCSECN